VCFQPILHFKCVSPPAQISKNMLLGQRHSQLSAHLPAGCGSGCNLAFARTMLAHAACSCNYIGVVRPSYFPTFATMQSHDPCSYQDINPHALAATYLTLEANQGASSTGSSLIRSDLLTCLRPASVDLLIFNPPYATCCGS
jgi:methylase of polypeptide subunit release factors